MQTTPHPHKGIILAGGSGTRLHPLTIAMSKQIMPVYDKPMIYYPLATLMAAGIRDIAIITTPADKACFQTLLGTGKQWGINLDYICQPTPDGLAQAFILAEDYLVGAPSVLILGDNIFHAPCLAAGLDAAMATTSGASVFGCRVSDPARFGVVSFDDEGRAKTLEEKPEHPKSDIAVTGLYVLDASAPARAKTITPSPRGELEITCLLKTYLEEDALSVSRLNGDSIWLDTGTTSSLFGAASFVERLQNATGELVGSPEIAAFRNGWLDLLELAQIANRYKKSGYGAALKAHVMTAAPTVLSPQADSRTHLRVAGFNQRKAS